MRLPLAIWLLQLVDLAVQEGGPDPVTCPDTTIFPRILGPQKGNWNFMQTEVSSIDFEQNHDLVLTVGTIHAQTKVQTASGHTRFTGIVQSCGSFACPVDQQRPNLEVNIQVWDTFDDHYPTKYGYFYLQHLSSFAAQK